MNPDVDAHVTIVPPRRATYTEAPKVSRPGCSKTMSGSSPPVSSRIRAPNRFHSFGSCVVSSDQNLYPSADRSMISEAPIARQISAFSGDDTMHTGIAPPFSANCVAYEPRPPDAPQTSTTSPCFMLAPFAETSCRYAVLFTNPGDAASSQVRCAGFGISWFDLTSASSARPPKFVSKPQIRCSESSIVSLCPSGDSSSTDRQCATTSTPARSEPTTWYGRSWRAVSGDNFPYRFKKANVDTGSKIDVQTVL